MPTMNVVYLYNLEGGEVSHAKWGDNPKGKAGKVFELPFSLGAHLVAAQLADPAPEAEEAPEPEEPEA